MQTNYREIIVKGIGKTTVTPDIIILNINFEALEIDYDKSMERGAEMLNSLREAVISAGHDGKELKTTNFNINTKYESYRVKDDYKQRFIGYRCSHGLRLEFDIDMKKLGITLGAIAKCQAKPNFNINFSVKDQNAVSEKLLESAIENAKMKAEILTKSAGVKLGAIQKIVYSWRDVHFYSSSNVDMDSCSDMICTASAMEEIEPEDINVNDTVTVVWAIG